MPWVVVLGEGAWLAERGLKLGPGKHEVSDEVADRARRSGITRLVVLAEEPEVHWHGPVDGPLTLENVKRGTPRGAYLPPAELPVPEPEPEGPPREHRCLHCPQEFPSIAALERHVEFHHR